MIDSEADWGEVVGRGRVALAQHRHRQLARQDDDLHVGRQKRRQVAANLLGLLTAQEAIGRDHDRIARLKSQPRNLHVKHLQCVAWLRAQT